MTSIVFPGQGSQFVGMAKDFHDNFKLAKSCFEEIEDYTSINIRKIIFDNDENKLDLTQFTQICIFSTSYVIYKILYEENNLINENVKVMLGHSLGEYSALACSNKINLKDCSLILKKRGELMSNAVNPNETGMAALIGIQSNIVQKIIDNNILKYKKDISNNEKKEIIYEMWKNYGKTFIEYVFLDKFKKGNSHIILNGEDNLSEIIFERLVSFTQPNLPPNFELSEIL